MAKRQPKTTPRNPRRALAKAATADAMLAEDAPISSAISALAGGTVTSSEITPSHPDTPSEPATKAPVRTVSQKSVEADTTALATKVAKPLISLTCDPGSGHSDEVHGGMASFYSAFGGADAGRVRLDRLTVQGNLGVGENLYLAAAYLVAALEGVGKSIWRRAVSLGAV